MFKTFSFLFQQSMKFQLLIKIKILKNKYIKFLAFKLTDVVFFMLINVKMPANHCWHFNIYKHNTFHAQFS